MKNYNISEMNEEFLNCGLIRIFEIPVVNKLTREDDYIIFDIEIDVKKNKFVAQHIALNEDEEKSNKIAFKEIDFDDCFSLDEHLQELLEECNQAIFESDFFEIKEDEE